MIKEDEIVEMVAELPDTYVKVMAISTVKREIQSLLAVIESDMDGRSSSMQAYLMCLVTLIETNWRRVLEK